MSMCARLKQFVSKDRGGNAAIEFALIAPILVIILAGSTDLGLLIFSRFRLEATISNSASYAMVHADQVDSKSGEDLATKIATIIASEDASGEAIASIVVNNGAKASYAGNRIKLGGAASQAIGCRAWGKKRGSAEGTA